MVKMKAIELTGTVDENHQLHLDNPIPIVGPNRVRVIVLYPGEIDDLDEREWLRTAANNPAFDFLKEPNEDIYTVSDGKQFYDKG